MLPTPALKGRESARPSVEQYKKQARELLQSLRSNQPNSLQRLATAAPHIEAAGARLADAQFVIARENGFESWPKFKHAIELSTADLSTKADAFVRAAAGNRLADAKLLLVDTPSLPQTNLYTAVVYGDVETVSKLISRTPDLVTKMGGPLDRQPISYLTWSRFIVEREAQLLETARLLLDNGADPNARYTDGEWELPTLYGACGQLNHPALAAILIDAGANVDDNESLYHSTEFRDHACLRLLLDRGAKVNGTNALKHMLDYEDVEGLNLLLDHGADPNELNDQRYNALHWAVIRRRSTACIEPLLRHGVDINAAQADGLTPYRLTLQLGQHDAAAFLESHGADTSSTVVDELLSAAATFNEEQVRSIGSHNPGLVASLKEHELSAIASFAEDGNTKAVGLLLDSGFPTDGRGAHKATPLHWAAWRGHPDTVQLLIDRGAEVEVEGADLGSTPLQWAIHASANNAEITQERAIAVIGALMDAGAVPRTLEMASESARAYIESRAMTH